MGADERELSGPDLERGIPEDAVADGALVGGHAGGRPVLLARRGAELFAVGGLCTHYRGPLAEGVLVGDTVRCPWHHACFSLRTGEALAAPALDPLACWEVERRDGMVYVRGERPAADGATPLAAPAAPVAAPAPPAVARAAPAPSSVVIVGAGGAGNAAAEMLRRQGYTGPVTMIGADDAAPYDRPNLSKDSPAGSAPAEWIPLRSPDFYAEHGIELRLGRRVTAVDASARRVSLDDGAVLAFGALLLATGAEPVRLPPHMHTGTPVRYLRTLADSRAIVAAAERARCAVVLGASFIGLEVAAALRARGLEVHVVGPEPRPLEKVLGPALGDFVRRVHERHGVTFHLGRTASVIDDGGVTLGSGERIDAQLVVAGIGVRPNTDLAAQAGLLVERGVVVDAYLETSAPGVYAAGDIARYPDPRTGEHVRVEHWVVAERQGQVAARNMLRGARGEARERYDAVPFFWSNHYDASITYVGHAERWDDVRVSGDVAGGDCAVAFRAEGRTLAVATAGRDRASLAAEVAMERGDARALDALLAAR
jgi:3-phenylpropionate/trans-cinnamate dioxygenase ferredoxin reductase subunit